ncbi:hypothetical protein B0H11DRAFT_2265209 [Mycena galericulata]|nr:hypothetical protein B0H11DRAFT_2265209 [Mycena galericulata]
MSTRHPCDPVFRPNPGQEDKIRHSNTSGCWFYVVGNGHMNAIFTDSEIAREQVNRFSGGAWKKASTWKEAIKVWRDFCHRYHRHTPLPVFDLSPTPSPPPASGQPPSPPPSPSPSPPPPPYETLVSGATSRSTSRPIANLERRNRETLPAHPPASTPTRAPRSTRAAPTSRVAPTAVVSLASSASTSRASGPRAADSSLSTPTTASSPAHTRPRQRVQVTQVRSPTVAWQDGDRLYGIEGVPCLFETRYDAVDYVFENHVPEVGILETRNRRRLVAFVTKRPYIRRADDPEDTE